MIRSATIRHSSGVDPLAQPVTSFSAADGTGLGVLAERPSQTTAGSSELDRTEWLDARHVYRAISEATRYRIIQVLSSGELLPAVWLAEQLGQDQRRISKHLKILRACGLVYEQVGSDRRSRFNGICPQFLKGLQNGVYIVDFGSGVLRIPAVK